MRIDWLQLKNFKGFESKEFNFHPKFNLIVGRNGSGKTCALDALSVAVGSWFLGIRGAETRHIRSNEVRLLDFKHEELDERGQKHVTVQWERFYPCEITASGLVRGREISWIRSLNSPAGRTTYVNATQIKHLASEADQEIRQGCDVTLPLVSYYGTGRLWQEPRESFTVSDPMKVASKSEQSRFSGYENSVDPRLSVSQLTRWIARQSWVAYQQQNRFSPVFNAVKKALISCVEDAQDLYFDANLGEVVVVFSEDTQPFSNLSDGQRCMLAMVGDIAQKAAKLNPHLGAKALQETPGVVLIDELDLHIHPRWQRNLIEDLRRAFPEIQFICTTHSPFLIQSLRSGEELIMLDGQPTAELGNMSIEEISQAIQQVRQTQVSERYAAMTEAAKSYLEMLEQAAMAPEEKLADYKHQLAESLKPYADNPAFQAFLEMKRVAKLGE